MDNYKLYLKLAMIFLGGLLAKINKSYYVQAKDLVEYLPDNFLSFFHIYFHYK